MLDIIDFHTSWRALEQNCPGLPREWYGAQEDHQGNKGACSRVSVKSLLVTRLPDDDGGNNDADVVDGIAYHVNEDA